ncbi:MAG: methyltransferase domain-containing protein [Deltaproteobacteria bacterium]|nr:methyltransferase domain-containing protein [Deltaproteobacteria bacterium]
MSSDDNNRHSNVVGYDRWSSSYDQYPNPTVAIDELSFPSLWNDLRGKHVLEIAKEKINGDSVTFLEADFMTYDGLPASSFDAAITSLVVEHIPDLGGFFGRATRVLRADGSFFLSEIHPERAAKGHLAHFKDAKTAEEIRLSSCVHSAQEIEVAAVQNGLQLIKKLDVLGDERLATMSPSWSKYVGIPMIQLWHFQKRRPVLTEE